MPHSTAFPNLPDPVPVRSSNGFYRWLESLRVLSLDLNRRGFNPWQPPILTCDCCGEDQRSYNNLVWDPINLMLQLPCNCRCLKWCLESLLGPEARGEECPGCGVRLLQWEEKQDTLKQYLESLEVVDVMTMDEEDRCCSICHEEFAGVDAVDTQQHEVGAIETTQEGEALEIAERIEEHPVRVKPCNHIFGHDCLKTWLTPGPEGGNSDSCPSCRGVIFSREKTEDDEGEGWFTDHTDFF